jgi:hypothetical protein
MIGGAVAGATYFLFRNSEFLKDRLETAELQIAERNLVHGIDQSVAILNEAGDEIVEERGSLDDATFEIVNDIEDLEEEIQDPSQDAQLVSIKQKTIENQKREQAFLEEQKRKLEIVKAQEQEAKETIQKREFQRQLQAQFEAKYNNHIYIKTLHAWADSNRSASIEIDNPITVGGTVITQKRGVEILIYDFSNPYENNPLIGGRNERGDIVRGGASEILNRVNEFMSTFDGGMKFLKEIRAWTLAEQFRNEYENSLRNRAIPVEWTERRKPLYNV